MPEAILTILKFCFLALLYLFLARVVRVVYLEMGGGASRTQAVVAAPPSGRRRSRQALRLKVTAPPESKGQVYDIADELTVGRAATCAISLEDDHYVSQVHARIFRRDGDVLVEDLGSTNGTYVNRRKVAYPMPVRRGDKIQIGKTVLEVSR